MRCEQLGSAARVRFQQRSHAAYVRFEQRGPAQDSASDGGILMKDHAKKIKNVLQLNAQARGDYFIRKIVDFEVVWGLFDKGWATAQVAGVTAIPFWPEEGFADLCASAEWAGFLPKSIELSDFLSRWLPGLEGDGRICVLFPTHTERGFLIQPLDLLNLINKELQQYE
jgi:hypothetical protein